MSVNVIFTGPIKAAAGEVCTTSDSETVRELVAELERRYGDEFGREAKKTKILVNGYAIQFYDFLDTKLKSGDTVDFLQNWRVMDKQRGSE
ncbi:MAG: MoaD/ThiS family protein [Pseudomonadota bacterium]